MHRPDGRFLAVLFLLAVVAAGLGMADPHHAVGGTPQELEISPALTPSVLWENANHNARRQSVTVVSRTYETPAAERLLRVERRAYDPDRRRARLTLFDRDGEPGEWIVSDAFVGEAVRASRIGDAARPARSAIRAEGTVSVVATRDGFESGDALARVDDPDEFRLLETGSTTIAIGTTGPGDYADLRGFDESEILPNSSYRAVIDSEGGRLVRIVDRRRLEREDGEVDGVYRVTTVDRVGETVVERPAWAPRGVAELVADALSV